ncbi:MAG TPA: hypothetical protein EYG68_09600 [Leucothrix mucor]|nr:hypothetical protein [Leucothrix mucor]
MHQTTIIYPLIGMVFLTFFVGVKMLFSRIRAVRVDGMNPAFFTLNKGAKQPNYLIKVTQHYENLFELPLLFYVAIMVIYTSGITDSIFFGLALLFVIIRCTHAFIHITYNNLSHRRNAFLIGTIVLFIIWLRISFHFLTV